MAFNVTGIGTWINENTQDLIQIAILESNTIAAVSKMTGVKYKEQIKYLSGDAIIQAYACGAPTTSGVTAITDKDVEVKDFMVYEELCPEDFATTSLQLSMKPGINAGNEEVPFEQQYADMKIKNLQAALEVQLWANSAASTTNIQGWIHQAEADSTVEDRTFVWSGTTWTASEYMAEVYGMVNALPATIQKFTDLTLFVGYEISRKMIQQFVITGNYHIDYVNNDGNGDWYFPGTNVIVKPTEGLNAVNSVFLTPASNLIVATDLDNEWEQFRLWYDIDDNQVKFRQAYRLGVSYYFGSYIVLSNA